MRLLLLTFLMAWMAWISHGFPNITNSLNVSIRHKTSTKEDKEDLYVLVSKKQNVHDDEGQRIAQVATSLLYQIDITSSRGLITLPDIPLKLYPHNEHRSSTFATFLPLETEGYFSFDNNGEATTTNDDGDNTDKSKLLWAGTKSHNDDVVSVVAELTGLEDDVRTVLVRVWDENIEQDPIQVTLPKSTTTSPTEKEKSGSDSATTTTSISEGGVDPSLKDVIFHYYRGSMCGKCYGKVQELHEYLNAAIVGFLSPFFLLGLIFIFIAMGVFLCCDLTRRNNRVQLPLNDDEEKRIEA